jgi:hypothetical protein
MYLDSPYDEDGKFTFEFAPCTNIKLNINNTNCQGASDIMNFRSRYNYTDFQSWSTDRVGCYSYLSPEFFKVPSGWRIYEWTVDRGGVVTSFKDSIYLTEGSSATFDMNY